MSPEEWAFKIGELIEEAESQGMKFYIDHGDFMVSTDEFDYENYPDVGYMVW